MDVLKEQSVILWDYLTDPPIHLFCPQINENMKEKDSTTGILLNVIFFFLTSNLISWT